MGYLNRVTASRWSLTHGSGGEVWGIVSTVAAHEPPISSSGCPVGCGAIPLWDPPYLWSAAAGAWSCAGPLAGTHEGGGGSACVLMSNKLTSTRAEAGVAEEVPAWLLANRQHH